MSEAPRSFSLDIVEGGPRRAMPAGSGGPGAFSSGADGDRPFLRVYFSCANQYVRVFRDRAGDGYTARCPTCGKSMKFRVRDGGTSQRFFELSCRR